MDGATVLYGSATELRETLEYDLSEEKKFSYRNLSMEEVIHHLALFVSRLWQIHVFGEGNTRTTAVFFIKYLRTLGFNVTNEIFAEHAWYFRNALVRANYNDLINDIYETTEYLELFLRNLLLNEKNGLHNRTMHISGTFNKYAEPDIDKTKPDIDKTKPDIDKTKPDIDKTKPDIDKTKPDIDKTKPDIESKLPYNISNKTKKHILDLFFKFDRKVIFGRSLVEETIGLKSSAASSLIKLMLNSEIIESVGGHGKGKYRFL